MSRASSATIFCLPSNGHGYGIGISRVDVVVFNPKGKPIFFKTQP